MNNLLSSLQFLSYLAAKFSYSECDAHLFYFSTWLITWRWSLASLWATESASIRLNLRNLAKNRTEPFCILCKLQLHMLTEMVDRPTHSFCLFKNQLLSSLILSVITQVRWYNIWEKIMLTMNSLTNNTLDWWLLDMNGIHIELKIASEKMRYEWQKQFK